MGPIQQREPGGGVAGEGNLVGLAADVRGGGRAGRAVELEVVFEVEHRVFVERAAVTLDGLAHGPRVRGEQHQRHLDVLALPLRADQEILTTTHDHYVTFECLRVRTLRSGAKVRRVPLYVEPEKATEDAIVASLMKAVGPRTRIIAVTWVHSSTGVKLPIRRMADALREVNRKRAEPDRALLCVDGVHAFGVEHESVAELGCDFLVAGCHKWLFGPRGTGIVWGRAEAWQGTSGIIPCFEWPAMEAWMHGQNPDAVVAGGPRMSPGGFQVYEHRWALPEAFHFHQQIGKERITARIHELATRCKQGLAALPKVKVHTPMSPALSAGITCFEIEGLEPKDVVARLLARKVVASNSPYLTSYVRLTPGVLNTPEEVDQAVAEVKALL